MRESRSGLNRLAITLEIILYTTLHKAVGRKPSVVMAFSYFGIRAMKNAFRACSNFLDLLESSTTSRISGLTVSQQALKKSTLNPYGLGAFPLYISLITSLTSSSETGLLRLWLSSLVTS